MREVRYLSSWPAAVTNSSTKFCGELGHNSEIFFKAAQVLNFKIFWRWTLNRYKRIKTTFNFKNYWRVLRMHILDKIDWDFNQRERRNIHNVSCLNYLNLNKFFADVLTMHSISTYSLMNIIFALCLKRSLSLTLTIFIFFFIHIEFLIIKHTRTSVNEFK